MRQPSCFWLLMYASAASRCASSELNSCARPSSVDLRVYMAQRTTRGSGTGLAATFASRGLQPEEHEAVPACAGDLLRDCAEGGVPPVLPLEAVREKLYDDWSAFVLPRNQSARCGQPCITAIPEDSV